MAHNAPQHNSDHTLHNLPYHNAGVHNGAAIAVVQDPADTADVEITWDSGETLAWDDGAWISWDAAAAIPDDFVISVPAGSYSANALDATNATNGAGGVSAGKMAATSAAAWTVLSVNSSRDQEISTSGNRFRCYLRYDGDKALYMRVDKTGVDGSTGILTVGVCTGLNTSAELATTYYPLYTTSTANATITGFNGGTEYLFGCSGLDLYVKIDGVERLRIQDYHHVVSGKAGVKPGSGYYVGAVTVNFNTEAGLYSTPSINSYDVRDLTGWKSTTTTGTISASSTSLTVASASGLAVGDYLIVEIGGEAATGRGTKGVGGTWPALIYADAATRAADTSQANATYAGQLDTGDVYRWTSGSPGSWAAVSASTDYYAAKIVPKSLVARITAISGVTVTLDTAATVAATNANVYVDMQPVINSLFAVYDGASNTIYGIAPTPMTVNIPTGTYYMSAGIYIPQNGTNVVHIQGGGKTTCILRSPQGVHSACIVSKSIGGSINDLHLWGNARFTGFGFPYNQCRDTRGYTLSGSTFVRNNSTTQAMVTNISETAVAFGYGAIFYQTSTCTIDNVKATDPWQSGAGAHYCTNPVITNVDIVLNDGLADYVQWMIQCADGTGETVTDCTLTSPILTGGFESFRSTGGSWARITSTNGLFSMNTADDWSIDTFTLTIEANSRLSGGGLGSVAGSGVPAVGVNFNIGGGTVDNGGTLTNYTLDQQGVVDASDNLITGFNNSASNPNVTLDTFSMTMPDYVVGGNSNYAPILAQGANTDIKNGTVTGKSVYNVTGSGNRNIHHSGSSTIASGSTITNCTAPDTYLA